MYFWVNVIKQPEHITQSIRKATADKMPPAYNNMACYMHQMEKWCAPVWGLKFACC